MVPKRVSTCLTIRARFMKGCNSIITMVISKVMGSISYSSGMTKSGVKADVGIGAGSTTRADSVRMVHII